MCVHFTTVNSGVIASPLRQLQTGVNRTGIFATPTPLTDVNRHAQEVSIAVSRVQWQRFQLSCLSRFSRLYRWICLVSGLSVPCQVIPHPTAACLCVCIAVLRCTFISSSFGCGHLCRSNTRCLPSSDTHTHPNTLH